MNNYNNCFLSAYVIIKANKMKLNIENENRGLAYCHCVDARGPLTPQNTNSKKLCYRYCNVKLGLGPKECRVPPKCVGDSLPSNRDSSQIEGMYIM